MHLNKIHRCVFRASIGAHITWEPVLTALDESHFIFSRFLYAQLVLFKSFTGKKWQAKVKTSESSHSICKSSTPYLARWSHRWTVITLSSSWVVVRSWRFIIFPFFTWIGVSSDPVTTKVWFNFASETFSTRYETMSISFHFDWENRC